MIGEKFTKLFNRPTKNLMIPASQVAVVNENDSLLHAILVLSSSGYQIIPVIDENNCIRGLISIPQIVKSFDNLSLFNEDKLAEIKVKEAMNQVVPILFDNYELEDVISLLIDNNFVCVTLKNGYFLGIIPRKVVLERFTQVAHNLEKEYKLNEKGTSAEWINRPNIIIGSKEADKQFLVKFHLVSLMAIYETLRVPSDDGAIIIHNLQQSLFANYIFQLFTLNIADAKGSIDISSPFFIFPLIFPFPSYFKSLVFINSSKSYGLGISYPISVKLTIIK